MWKGGEHGVRWPSITFLFLTVVMVLFAFAGLTCAMYTSDSLEINCPDKEAGLYIRTRNNDIVKVIVLSLFLV